MLTTERIQRIISQDPAEMQAEILAATEDEILGDGVISDNNSVSVFFTEMVARCGAGIMAQLNREFNALYPKRAQTFPDLYRHMATFDHLGLFSSPASTEILLYLDHNWIVTQGHKINSEENHRKAEIPKDTVFQIGDYSFRIHYPIEISTRGNASSSVGVSVLWNTETDNPIHTLTSSTVEHHEEKIGGKKMLILRVPVEQFSTDIYVEAVGDRSGFVGNYKFTDQFYTARVYQTIDGEREELETTLSDKVYDTDKPTALLTVDPENQTLKVAIPQVYFETNNIGSKLEVEVYTTKGELDIDVSNIKTADTTMIIGGTGPAVNAIISMPVKALLPGAPVITGGTNGYTYEELRSRVLEDSFSSGAPVSTAELMNYFEDAGFMASRYRDGITDRIYHCSRMVKVGSLDDREIFPGGFVKTMLPVDPSWYNSDEVGSGSGSGILPAQPVTNTDGSITIPPDVVYRLNKQGMAEPYDNISAFTDYLQGLNLTSLSNMEINGLEGKQSFLISPYHTRIHTQNRYPIAYSYLLTEPKITSLYLHAVNDQTSYRISVRDIKIDAYCRGFSSGTESMTTSLRYRVNMTVVITEDLLNEVVKEADGEAYVLLVFSTHGGGELPVTIPLKRSSVETTSVLEDVSFVIDTDAEFADFESLNTMVTEEFSRSGTNNPATMPLNPEVEVYGICKGNIASPSADEKRTFKKAYQAYQVIGFNYDEHVVLNQQKLVMNLGHHVSQIHNPVAITYTSNLPDNIEMMYSTYKTNTYLKNESGIPRIDISTITDWHEITDFGDGTGITSQAEYHLSAAGGGESTPFEVTGVGDPSTDPTDVEVGMAVYKSGATAALTHVETVFTEDSTTKITLSKTPDDTDALTEAGAVVYIARVPESEQLVYPLKDRLPGDWVFPDHVGTYDMTIDGSGVCTTTDADAIELLERFFDPEYSSQHNLCISVVSEGIAGDTRDSYTCGGEIIAPGTWISGIDVDGATVTLTLENDSEEDPVLKYIDDTVSVYIGVPEVRATKGMPEPNGDKNLRQIQYRTNLMLFDVKPFLSDGRKRSAVLDLLHGSLSGYYSTVDAIRPNLLPSTDLFFVPTRTIGTDVNKAGNGKAEVDLQLRVKLRLHMLRENSENPALVEDIRGVIIDIMDKHSSSGRFSLSAVASKILDAVSDSVEYVDAVGIADANGEYTVTSTIIPTEENTAPVLGTILTKDPVIGGLQIDRDLVLETVPVN